MLYERPLDFQVCSLNTSTKPSAEPLILESVNESLEDIKNSLLEEIKLSIASDSFFKLEELTMELKQTKRDPIDAETNEELLNEFAQIRYERLKNKWDYIKNLRELTKKGGI